MLLALVSAAWAPRLGGPIDLRYDGAAYYTLGASLASGQGYRLTNEPGAIEALQYPPLFPLWIAAHMRLLGSTDPVVVAPALRWSQAALSLAYAVALLALALRFLPTGYAFLAALLCALSFRTIYLSDLLFPELAFALVSVLFFLAAGSAGRARFLAGPLALVAYLLRTAGVALFAAWVGEALLARRWRAALGRAALCALPLVAWQAYVARVEASAAYRHPAYAYQRAPYLYANVSYGRNLFLVDPFAPERGHVDAAGLARRALDNAAHLPVFVGELLSAPMGEWVWPLKRVSRELAETVHADGVALWLLGALGGVAFLGLALLAARGEHLAPLYVLAALAMITLTPWQNQFWRYLTPLCPYLALGLVYGFWRARERAGKRGRLALGALLAMVLALELQCARSMFAHSWRSSELSTPAGMDLAGHAFYVEPEWDAFQAALKWLRANAEPEAVVGSAAPQLVHLSTGLRSVMPPFESDLEAAQVALDSVPVRYLIVEDLSFLDITRRYTRPLVEARSADWELVYQPADSRLAVWRRKTR